MPKITFIDAQGTSRTVEAETGSTVMEVAVRNGVPGIEAECGGSCACATCHCYAEGEAAAHLPPPSEGELAMLEHVVAERRPSSRLSCQIKAAPTIDGLILRVAETQS